MRRVIIFGFGLMGFTVAREMSSVESIDEILIVDTSDQNLKRVNKLKKEMKQRKINILTLKKDVIKDKEYLVQVTKNSILGIGSLPHSVARDAMDICLEAGVNFVDLVYDAHLKNFREIDRKAKESGTVVIPSMGVAPGLSNAMVAHGVRMLDKTNSVKIYVGGVPEHRTPPLDYKIVFSATSVVNEYIRDATIRRGGKIIKVPALSEVEEVNFLSYKEGNFEAVLTDGLSTLLNSFPKINNMEEKTIRWKGHNEKVNFLRDMGILSNDKINTQNGCVIRPSEILAIIMKKHLKMKRGDKDITLMKVEVKGSLKGEKVAYVQELFDRYDDEQDETSMARTTGFTCAIVGKMVIEGLFKKPGFFPPEKAMSEINYRRLKNELIKRGILINETLIKLP
jgi:lysine 6-dehydrogenase